MCVSELRNFLRGPATQYFRSAISSEAANKNVPDQREKILKIIFGDLFHKINTILTLLVF